MRRFRDLDSGTLSIDHCEGFCVVSPLSGFAALE